MELSIEDLPEVDRATKCALPLIFTSSEHPEYPGIRATSTALRYGRETVFVTAAHVVARNADRTTIELALGFRGEPLRCGIRDAVKPRPTGDEDAALCDFAVLRPVSSPSFIEGDSEAHDISRFARMAAAHPKSLFAMCGYPSGHPSGNIIDYSAHTITFGLQLAIGTYRGPSPFKGHHTLDVDTAQTGGPDGFSGGPVFRLLFDEERQTWIPA